MEAKGCGQRWKMHHSEFKHGGRSTSQSKDSERGRAGDRGRPHKSVTMAPTSRYLMDRQYVVRKPLFSLEQHTSILKKTQPEQGKQPSVVRAEARQPANLSRHREVPIPESFSLPPSPPPAFREDLASPWGDSDFRSRMSCEGSPLLGSRSPQRSLSSSILEVQRLNPPLRPRLTSTVLYPTYSRRSAHCRQGQAELKPSRNEFRGGGETNPKEYTSPYQANYWACAIPKDLPPSSDRHSTGWDPNRDYQALLDYTYPLKPGQVVSEGNSTKPQESAFLQSDPNLQDSGIELDHLCSSASLSEMNFSLSGTGQTRERSAFCVGQRSPDIMGHPSSGTLLSLTEPALSMDSCDWGTTGLDCSSTLLPWTRCAGGVDEEFRPLPEQLEELQLLSRQVRKVTAQLSWPVAASWESLEPGTVSIQSPISPLDKQEAEDSDRQTEVAKDTDEGKEEADREKKAAAPTVQLISEAADHCDSDTVRTEALREGLGKASLKEVEALVEQLCGTALPGTQRRPEHQQHSDSLMQHIQIFCSHLEQLIHWLYTVSKKMDMLVPPTVDIESVKSSLAEYQSFQREVSSRQPLTSSVLHTGQLLLSCINTTSPILRDTLLLIERQSRTLESHTEHLFSSILSAMDSLTHPSQPSPVLQSRAEDQGPLGVEGSSL